MEPDIAKWTPLSIPRLPEGVTTITCRLPRRERAKKKKNRSAGGGLPFLPSKIAVPGRRKKIAEIRIIREKKKPQSSSSSSGGTAAKKKKKKGKNPRGGKPSGRSS